MVKRDLMRHIYCVCIREANYFLLVLTNVFTNAEVTIGALAKVKGLLVMRSDSIVKIFWNEPKVSKMYLIPFYPDYCSWALDFCFVQFCYIVCGGGSAIAVGSNFRQSLLQGLESQKELMLPNLMLNGGSKIGEYLKECVGKIRYMHKDQNISAKSLRSGALQEISIHPAAGRDYGVIRGGWTEVTSDHYMNGCDGMHRIASKTIRSHPNPRYPLRFYRA